MAVLLALALVFQQPAPRPERDLAVEVRAPAAPVRAGEQLALEMALVNRSAVATHWAVKPGDGSEVGWREPRVWFTAERFDTKGNAWLPLAEPSLARCGLYDPSWQKDVVRLGPGERLALKGWLPDPAMVFQLAPGRYRLVVHYAFRGGASKGHIAPTEPPRDMPGAVPYEVASAPVEVTVVR